MADASLMITIGATVAGALSGIDSVQTRITALGDTTNRLRAQQVGLQQTMSRPMGTSAPASLAALNREYEQLGRSVSALQASQTRLNALQANRQNILAHRQELKSEALTLGVSALALAVPVKLAIDFESAMADVKKVVDFDTPDGFKKLGENIVQMTRTLPLAATELSAIAASGGQLGVAAKDLPKFTETVAKMATAFDMPAEQAGDAMAKLANVYQIPIGNIGRLGDAINELSNKSPAKASDIVSALSRVGGVAKQFGLTEMQAASLSNAFISLGKPPEVAATAMNGMLMKLGTADKQGKKFQKALASIGMNAQDLKKAIGRDAQGALVEFLKQIEKLPKAQQMGALVDMFGLEYADDVAVLSGSVKTYTDSIETLQQVGKNGKASFTGSMDKEFAARSATTANQLKLFKNGMTELGITIGSTLLPAVNSVIASLLPMAHAFADFAKQNPEVVGGIVKVVGALVLFKGASLVTRFGLSYLWGGFNSLATAGGSFVARWRLATALLRSGSSAFTVIGRVIGFSEAWVLRLGKAFGWLGNGAAKVGGRAVGLGRMLGGRLLGGLRLAAQAVWRLGSVLKGPLLTGLRLAAQAVWWLGRALLMNPIGLAITAIAVGAYLIYRYWAPIKAFFMGLWTQVKTAFNGGLLGMGKLILNWSPLGLFYKAFAAVLRWFGVKLPADFTGFGAMLLNGLMRGITAKLSAAKAAIVGFGENIKDWFKSALGINSPSKVFMGFGAGIGGGASLGILKSLPSMKSAVGKLSGLALAGAAMGVVPAGAGFAAALGGAGGAGGAAATSAGAGRAQVVFSPTIHVTVSGPGAASNAQGQVTQALHLSMAEFERLMQRYLQGKQRTGF